MSASQEAFAPLVRRLREIRDATGMSRSVLADRIGLSERQVARVETGDRQPRPGEVAAWAEKSGALDELPALMELYPETVVRLR